MRVNNIQKTLGIIQEFLPPILVKFLKYMLGGWYGDFQTWEQVLNKSKGYNDPIIFDKVLNSSRKVRDGLAVFERDSVVFDQEDYNWPLLSALLLTGLYEKNELKLIDFGGALGSVYFQNKKLLTEVLKIDWNIIEQENFVKMGKNEFDSKFLHFHHNIQECMDKKDINTFLLSSVVQYLPDPFEFIKKIIKYKFKYIIIDRTPFIKGKTRLTLQKVPFYIYKATYPCWLINREYFNSLLEDDYEKIYEYISLDQGNFFLKFYGALYKIKTNKSE